MSGRRIREFAFCFWFAGVACSSSAGGSKVPGTGGEGTPGTGGSVGTTGGAGNSSDSGGGPILGGRGGNGVTAGSGGQGGATVGGPWATWPMPNSAADVAAGAPHLQSYTSNGDGTVTDTVTGLMWQQPPAAAMVHADAATYCPALRLGGQSDWRLPALIELLSLVDYGDHGPVVSAAIDAGFFPSTPPGQFWTATTVGNPAAIWEVTFADGSNGIGLAPQGVMVRCVRTAIAMPLPSGGQYTIADTTVTDNGTMLTWQRSFPVTTFTWANAGAYCVGAGATLGGSGWRLPTIKELATLIDASQSSTTTADIDHKAFPSTPAAPFWSATPRASVPTSAWMVDFGGGSVEATSQTTPYNVRCVR